MLNVHLFLRPTFHPRSQDAGRVLVQFLSPWQQDPGADWIWEFWFFFLVSEMRWVGMREGSCDCSYNVNILSSGNVWDQLDQIITI